MSREENEPGFGGGMFFGTMIGIGIMTFVFVIISGGQPQREFWIHAHKDYFAVMQKVNRGTDRVKLQADTLEEAQAYLAELKARDGR